MMSTPQVEVWKGDFGDAYIERNRPDDELLRRLTRKWANLLDRIAIDPPKSILEVGANVGSNLLALERVTNAQLWALEPNARARQTLERILPKERILDATAETIPLRDESVEMVFTSGVLVCIHPDHLLKACSEIVRCARKYIVCIEFFAHEPETKRYRDNDELLFKRDFGAYYLDHFPSLKIVDYGFNWARTTGDGNNSTWWIMRR